MDIAHKAFLRARNASGKVNRREAPLRYTRTCTPMLTRRGSHNATAQTSGSSRSGDAEDYDQCERKVKGSATMHYAHTCISFSQGVVLTIYTMQSAGSSSSGDAEDYDLAGTEDKTVTINDFRLLKVIGKGSFGKVRV